MIMNETATREELIRHLEKEREKRRQAESALKKIRKDHKSLLRERQALKESKKRLENVLFAVQTGILVVHCDTRIITKANPAALQIIEATKDQVVGKEYHEFFSPDEHQACPYPNEGQDLNNAELTLRTVDGREKQILKTFTPLTIQNSQYLLESFVDISGVKETEKRLQEAVNEMEALLAAITSILIEINFSDRVTRWNRQAAATFGIFSEDATGRLLGELPIEWNFSEVQEGINTCRHSRKTYRSKDLSFTRQNGSKGILGLTMNPFFDDHNEVSGILIMGADITDRKILESQLAHAQKLESMGQLAAGIAHEINTPIQYVGDNTQFLQQAFQDLFLVIETYAKLFDQLAQGGKPEDCIETIRQAMDDADFDFLRDEVPRAVEQTLQGVERVSGIVKSMKDFSHPGGEDKVAADINKAILSTLTISKNEYKYVAEVITDLEKHLPLIHCFPDEINQVFLNIIINAAHAIADTVDKNDPRKGAITVKTRSTDDSVEIRISDTGPGIPDKDLPHIFDPFFTTKEVGKGTGQGLSLSYATIVEKHGGTLSCKTKAGEGSTFIIRLPR